VLAVTLPDGEREERRLDIAKREYDIQRVDGVPQNTVTPDPAELALIKARGERDPRAARNRRRGSRFRHADDLAGARADQRRLWQPAHLERRAARAAYGRRHRRAGRLADRRRRRGVVRFGRRALPHRQHPS